MKPFWKCNTIRAAVTLPLVGWAIQHQNGGMLPIAVQTWGPLAVAIGVILLRRATSEACRFCGHKG